jgi:HD superfamily phosphodiesterase
MSAPGWITGQCPGTSAAHAELVAWMAYVLGVMLRGQGIQLDPILAHRGGLLHDLDKLHTLDPWSHPHGEMGAAFLAQQGHPDLAQIVAGHVLRTSLAARNRSSPLAGRPSWSSSAIN